LFGSRGKVGVNIDHYCAKREEKEKGINDGGTTENLFQIDGGFLCREEKRGGYEESRKEGAHESI
jgi:hypothetical protein